MSPYPCTRALCRAPQERPTARICSRRRASSPEAGRWVASRPLRFSINSPMSWVPRSARHAQRSMRALPRITCRWGRRGRSLRRSCTSRLEFPAQSSISPASRMRAPSSPSTKTPKRRSSRSPTLVSSAISFKSCPNCKGWWRAAARSKLSEQVLGGGYLELARRFDVHALDDAVFDDDREALAAHPEAKLAAIELKPERPRIFAIAVREHQHLAGDV